MFLTSTLISLPTLAKLICCHPLDTAHMPALCAFAYAGPVCSVSLPWALPGHPQRPVQRLPLPCSSSRLPTLSLVPVQTVDDLFPLRASVVLYIFLTGLCLVSQPFIFSAPLHKPASSLMVGTDACPCLCSSVPPPSTGSGLIHRHSADAH